MSILSKSAPTTSRRRHGAAPFIFGLAVIGVLVAMDNVSAQTGRRTPYQAYLAADCIDGSNFCKFTTETVPARRVLEIQRVACQGWHTSDTPPTFVVMAELRTGADAYIGRIDFLEARYSPASWGSVWSISEQVQMFIPAAHKVRINLNSGSIGVGSYGCTLSGYLVET